MTMVGAAPLAMGSTVFAGMGLSLNGTDFDGIYDLDTVHHAIGMSGHKTSIPARRASAGRAQAA
jgi:hypothetical protein